MLKSPSRQKLFWLILAGLMTLAVLMIFLCPIIFGYYPETANYREWLLVHFSSNYPLDLITYLLPFAGIVYLTLVIPKEKIVKKIRYIIAVLSMIILCFIIVRRINSIYVMKDRRYEYMKITESKYASDFDTGYNVMDFVLWR